MTSPSVTPRKLATWSQVEATVPLAWKVRSPVRVSATRAPFSPVTMMTRSLKGVSQLTVWETMTPLARTPLATTMSSFSRPERWATWALMAR